MSMLLMDDKMVVGNKNGMVRIYGLDDLVV